jgi:hypothetical protein
MDLKSRIGYGFFPRRIWVSVAAQPLDGIVPLCCKLMHAHMHLQHHKQELWRFCIQSLSDGTKILMGGNDLTSSQEAKFKLAIFYFYCMVRTTSSQNKKYTCKNNFNEKIINLSSSIYFYCIVCTTSSLMELKELHALVTGVTVTSYSYSTGYSYSSIVSHSSFL